MINRLKGAEQTAVPRLMGANLYNHQHSYLEIIK